jgi:hypothetical protein
MLILIGGINMNYFKRAFAYLLLHKLKTILFILCLSVVTMSVYICLSIREVAEKQVIQTEQEVLADLTFNIKPDRSISKVNSQWINNLSTPKMPLSVAEALTKSPYVKDYNLLVLDYILYYSTPWLLFCG